MAEKIVETAKAQQNTKTSPFTDFLKEYWAIILLAIYVFSPIDLLPEAIFGPLGYSDDIVLIIIESLRRLIISKKNN